jgi:hypothetical protein
VAHCLSRIDHAALTVGYRVAKPAAMPSFRITLEWRLSPDPLPRIAARDCRSTAMWRPMWQYQPARDGDVVDEATFEPMFAQPDCSRSQVEKRPGA